VFLTTAVLGVPVEQDAQVLVAIVQSLSANPLASLYLLGYVMLVYGSIMGLAYLPLEEALRHPRQRGHWIKYLVAMALMYVGSAALFVAVSVLARGLGLIASLSRTVG
jgi:succinate dehydrogenase hydrophobic anchor subunit